MAGSRVRMPFGKFKGDKVEDVPSQYLVWLLESEAIYDDALRRVLVLEVIHRIAPEYKPQANRGTRNVGFDQEPTPRRGYDPSGVFDMGGERAGTKGSDGPRPTPIKGQAPRTTMMRELVDAGYRALSRRYHPDAGGSHEDMAALNAAVEALRKMVPNK